MPKVSIITPIHNCEDYVEAMVQSVKAQTESDWEHIIVDDGSTDKSPEILARLKEDPRIIVIHQAASGRSSFPRNEAIRHATGEIIAFLDADDLWDPTSLKRSLDIFNKYPEVDLTFNTMKRFITEPQETNDLRSVGGEEFFEIAGKHMAHIKEDDFYLCNEDYYISMSADICGMMTSSIKVRKSLLDREPVWFHEDLNITEDIDLWFRFVKNGKRVAYLREILTYYRQLPSSLTHQRESWALRIARAHEINLNRARGIFPREDYKRYRKKVAFMYFSLGYLLHRNRKKSEARRAYVQALRIDPGIPPVIAILKTFIPHRLIVTKHESDPTY